MENYLVHHGIDNQKWGVRNGPPYPLQKAVSNAIKQGQNAAVAKSSSKVVNAAANKASGKNKKLDIDTEKLVKEALFTFGTVAVTSLLATGVNAGINAAASTAYWAGKNHVNTILARAGHSIAKAHAASKGMILI